MPHGIYWGVDVVGMGTFETWYRDLYPRLHAAVRVLCRSTDEADEVTAEALGRAAERWHRVALMENPDGWTYSVARNLVRSGSTRRTRTARTDPLTEESAAQSCTDLGDATQRFVELVAPLPPRMREVLVLRHVADLTEPAIAEALGISRGTVSSTLSDAHQRLAAQLLGDEPDAGAVRGHSARGDTSRGDTASRVDSGIDEEA